MRLRKENKLSQADMAKILNMSTTAYHNKETGKSHFIIDEMFAIRNLFNLPMEDIFLPSDSNLVGVTKEK